MEKNDYTPDILNLYIEQSGPKLTALFKKIDELDDRDLKESGKQFKHMIFTDVRTSAYGSKIIASAMNARGYTFAQRIEGPNFELHSDEDLLKTRGKNFATLMSKPFFERKMSMKHRKSVIQMYNRRPDNINGDLVRFIILDGGFKEGIDLYDVKYVHLFEPMPVPSDQKQAIGRGTRFCGQSGLSFNALYGWPLYVFIYDVEIPEQFRQKYIKDYPQSDAESLFQMYLEFANIDLRKITFANELDNLIAETAVDADLTNSIHRFGKGKLPLQVGGRRSMSRSPNTNTTANTNANSRSLAPQTKMTYPEMRKYITQNFSQFAYPSDLKLENGCIEMGKSKDKPLRTVVNFTPTQDFVRNYFTSDSAYKGILYYHSVGSGKTCSAIATATNSFESRDYTILWVTRHTLKTDIWKNMYNQVCSITLQQKMDTLPAKIDSPLKYLPKNWMAPISYKQFSNMLLKKNKIYDEMVRRNGKTDPLRKTLIIIDEAHKIYSPLTEGSERPKTEILEEMIDNSYKTSGKDSVRIVAMSGTPYTEDAMEMISLLNLMREPGDKLPTDFKQFSKMYLNTRGAFTDRGKELLSNQLAGTISYLNRSFDARNFAYPVIENVRVPMTIKSTKSKKEMQNERKEKRKAWSEELKTLNTELKSLKADEVKACIDAVKANTQIETESAKTTRQRSLEDCKSAPKETRVGCRTEARNVYKTRTEQIKTDGKEKTARCKTEDGSARRQELRDKIKAKKDKHAEERKEERKKMEEYRTQSKALLNEVRDLRQQVRGIYERKSIIGRYLQREKEKIKTIIDKLERREAQKKLKGSIGKEFDEMKRRLQRARQDINLKKMQRKIMSYRAGKGQLEDLSQETVLRKECGVKRLE